MPRLRSKDFDRLSRIVGALETRPQEGLTQQIVRKFRLLVLDDRIKPGECLPPERRFAVTLGVSRSSLRGALKPLQIMGVLEVRQGTGTYLAEAAKKILAAPPKVLLPLKALSQAELFEARRWIEAGSAATAAERATHADLIRIREEFHHEEKCGERKHTHLWPA